MLIINERYYLKQDGFVGWLVRVSKNLSLDLKNFQRFPNLVNIQRKMKKWEYEEEDDDMYVTFELVYYCQDIQYSISNNNETKLLQISFNKRT